MKVAILEQYLRSLLAPLRAVGAPHADDLERACQTLHPFGHAGIGAFADFLQRAKTFDETGQVLLRPQAAGALVTAEPPLTEYAARLKDFLGVHTSPGHPITKEAKAEVEKLFERFKKPADLKKFAQAAGITGIVKTGAKGAEQIIVHLVGHDLDGKPAAQTATPKSAAKGKVDVTKEYVDALRAIQGADSIAQKLEEYCRTLTVANLNDIAKALGGDITARNKDVAKVNQAITDALVGGHGRHEPLLKQLIELQRRADHTDEPIDSIRADLENTLRGLAVKDAVQVSQLFEVTYPTTNPRDAVDAIKHKVLLKRRERARMET